ncbi:ABC transporter family substrate-binding protein [Mariniluteicoccus flavus]
MKYRKTAVAALATLALGLTACGGGGGGPQTGGGAPGQPGGSASKGTNTSLKAEFGETPRDQVKDGGTLTTSIVEINAQMNGWHGDSSAYTTQLEHWFTPVTVSYTPDGEWKPNPDYFTDVKSEEKGGKTVVTYTINPKANWNDGTAIDWKAIESGWIACGKGDEAFSCNSTDGYDQIESVAQGADAKQAVVTFKAAFPWWKGLFNSLLHPKAANAEVFNQGFVNNPHPEWGAGPYKIDQFDANKGIVSFVPNEKWWGNKGKLDKRIFQQMEESASINAFKNGQIDATGVSSKDRLAQVKDMQGIEVRKGNTPSNGLYTLNTASPVLSDIKVREAVMAGIDRKTIADISFQGLDYTENLPGSFLLFPWQKGYNDNFGSVVKFDKAKAGQILDEAGWKKNAEGVREKDGKKLTVNFVLFGDNPVRKNMAKALQSMQKENGVDLVVVEKASGDFAKVMKAKEFDIVYSGFLSGDPFGVAYTCQIWCSNSTLNKSGAGTKEIDAKLQAMAKIGTEEGQISEANKIEAEAMKSFGIMPVLNGPTLIAVKKDVANYGAGVFNGSPLKSWYPVQDIGFKK